MIESNIPYDDNLNIGLLSKVFERKRISNCYKYFWFMAILENISENKVQFTYNELLNQMIADSWYMVTEYKLRLGPCNTKDNLEEVVKYIFETTELTTKSDKVAIIKKIESLSNRQINEYKKKLIVNVPYCMQSPFYDSIKSPGHTKVDEINTQKHLVYYFVAINGLNSSFRINPEWAEYLIRNKEVLKDWVRYNLIGYLQDRNPSVPGIIDKIVKPEKRDLKRVSDFWKNIIELDPGIMEIYTGKIMKGEKISIDHFVPWQYVAHDELWNLSPTTPGINSMKGNHLPDFEVYYEKLSLLEYRAYEVAGKSETARRKYEICLDYHVNSLAVRSSLYEKGLDFARFNERLQNIIRPVYDSAKMCGFTEWNPR